MFWKSTLAGVPLAPFIRSRTFPAIIRAVPLGLLILKVPDICLSPLFIDLGLPALIPLAFLFSLVPFRDHLATGSNSNLCYPRTSLRRSAPLLIDVIIVF